MARIGSLLFAVALSLGLLLLPALRARELSPAGHGLLPPLLLAVSALFVHGVGFRPRPPLAARLLSPQCLWPATAALALGWWLAS